ncbi:MAG: hypothetical protein AB7D57_00795 [Desulfovibrionaceae bacterium]
MARVVLKKADDKKRVTGKVTVAETREKEEEGENDSKPEISRPRA